MASTFGSFRRLRWLLSFHPRLKSCLTCLSLRWKASITLRNYAIPQQATTAAWSSYWCGLDLHTRDPFFLFLASFFSFLVWFFDIYSSRDSGDSTYALLVLLDVSGSLLNRSYTLNPQRYVCTPSKILWCLHVEGTFSVTSKSLSAVQNFVVPTRGTYDSTQNKTVNLQLFYDNKRHYND